MVQEQVGCRVVSCTRALLENSQEKSVNFQQGMRLAVERERGEIDCAPASFPGYTCSCTGHTPSLLSPSTQSTPVGQRHWLVLDGPVGAGLVESLAALVAPHGLCLPNGEKLLLPGQLAPSNTQLLTMIYYPRVTVLVLFHNNFTK